MIDITQLSDADINCLLAEIEFDIKIPKDASWNKYGYTVIRAGGTYHLCPYYNYLDNLKDAWRVAVLFGEQPTLTTNPETGISVAHYPDMYMTHGLKPVESNKASRAVCLIVIMAHFAKQNANIQKNTKT